MRDLDDIQRDLEAVANISVKPDFLRPKEGDVIDYDQTVRWNIEEVKRLQYKYDSKVEDLKSAKVAKQKRLREELYQIIVNETSDKITIEDAKRIYSFAYQERHSSGYHDVFAFLNELIRLVTSIVNGLNE